MLPTLSRMAAEDWRGLSVLYLCPIKALLNNLESRLTKLTGFVGRTAALWHGDIGAGDKRRTERELPDVLLTTPESLEGILLGRSRDHQRLLGSVRCVVIDELHAFAGDDRGWHVLALIERIRAISGIEMQRIGLSATVGSPQSLLEWLAGHCDGERQLVQISGTPNLPNIEIDWVGTLDNAAAVISQLHRGEKRLVFCDSRSKVEDLAQGLRLRGVDTFVSHAALSADTRRQAELAFSERQNCVIVATSTLELGLDVGDLDRVIQIDAPPSVASFLQRLGRTGRREGMLRNTLFLTTTEIGLLESAALIHLFKSGFVEPVAPPGLPYPILVQQFLSSILQSGNRLTVGEFESTLRRVPQFRQLIEQGWPEVVSFLESEGWTYTSEGTISLGQRGDKAFSGKGLADLCVSFESARTFAVLYGDKHLGDVDPTALQDDSKGSRIISLGGRPWKVSSIDWRRQRAYVEPSEERGKTNWLGHARGISARVAGAVKELIESPKILDEHLTQRARKRMGELADDLQWTLEGGPVCTQSGSWSWWTFAGSVRNRLLAGKIQSVGGKRTYDDGYKVDFTIPAHVLERIGWKGLADIPDVAIAPSPSSFKFDELLPVQLQRAIKLFRSAEERF